MTTGSRHVVDAASLTAGSGLRAASQLGVIVVLSSHGGPVLVGKFAFALAISTPVFLLSELALRNVFVTLHVRPRYFTFFKIRLIANLIATVVVISTSCIPSGPEFTLIAALALAKWADSCLDILYASLQRRSRIKAMAFGMGVNGVLIVTLFSVLLMATDSLGVGILGWAAGSSLLGLIVAREVVQFERRSDSTLPVGGALIILKAGASSGMAQSINSLQAYLPILLLSLWSSGAEAGIFTTVGYFVTFANLIMVSGLQAVLPRMVSKMRNGSSDFMAALRRVAILYATLGAVLGLLTYFFGNWLIVLVYGPEFSITSEVLIPIALVLATLPLIYVSSLTLLVSNRYGAQVHIASYGIVLAMGLSLLLRPGFGVVEAAWVMFFGIAVRSALGMWLVAIRRVGWRQPAIRNST